MNDIMEIDGKWYDMKPNNDCFLTAAMELKDIGVINWYAPLEICNTELTRIPPTFISEASDGSYTSDPDIVNLRARVMEECKKNPWYFLREVVMLQVTTVSMFNLIYGVTGKKVVIYE